MAIVQSLTLTATQGQDTISKTVYVSGDVKTVASLEIKGSGLHSGCALAFDPSMLKSIYVNSDQDNMRWVAYGLSGSVTHDLQANVPYLWYSGGYFANAFPAASGIVTASSFQQLSGFVSGVISAQIIRDGTP